MRLNIGLALIALSLVNCTQKSNTRPVLDVAKKDQQNVDYVVRFDTASEAQQHIDELNAQGVHASSVAGSKNVIRVSAPASKLSEITVPRSASLASNETIRIVHAKQFEDTPPTAEDLPQSYLTARKVLGVDELLKRFPTADGRNIKAAVIDTGIEFNVPGLTADKSKILGHYDFTKFGRIKPTTLAQTAPLANYAIEGVNVSFDAAGLGAKSVEAVGLLRETELTKQLIEAAGVDINENEKFDDVFAFVVGENADGQKAVWIDANLDGVIRERNLEELTDFNTTRQSIALRADASPSGAKPLAVTIGANNDLQFHVIVGGHGTSCATIIAGNGYLNGRIDGMVPKAQLLSYVIDAGGKDVYTVDQLLANFLHAREQGADVISVSWGFAAGDLQAARFFADTLDKEVAAKGSIIGIAAGNEGPGTLSAASDDYIPHNGFGVGALISKDQARNVYGWSGAQEDAVIWYSSVGPTRGGRLIPDVISPLMTYVRGERTSHAGTTFYPFGGTSSATPALMGASGVLISALKQAGEATIDARLFKLAIQNSAALLPGVDGMRQGAGTANVNAAYDLYLKLANEKRASEADASLSKSFPIELRAAVSLAGQSEKGEGIVLNRAVSSVNVKVSISEDSLKQLDGLSFFEPLVVSHSESFLNTPSVLPLSTNGAAMQVGFDTLKLATPGLYTDIILLSRASDGLVLLRIPVAVSIAVDSETNNSLISSVHETLKPFQIKKIPLYVSQASPLRFDGVLQNVGNTASASLQMTIFNDTGAKVFSGRQSITNMIHTLQFAIPTLAQGFYEVELHTQFGTPSQLGNVLVSGALHHELARIVASQQTGSDVSFALEARENFEVASATLTLDHRETTVTLTRGEQMGYKGFFGMLDIGYKVASLENLSLKQEAMARALAPMLNVTTSLFDAESGMPLFWNWVAPGVTQPAELSSESSKVQIVAFPNVVSWDNIQDKTLTLVASVPLAAPLSFSSQLEAPKALLSKQTLSLGFSMGEQTADIGFLSGTLVLKDKTSKTIATLPVSF